MKYTVVGLYLNDTPYCRVAMHIEADSPEQAEVIANEEDDALEHGWGLLTVAGVFEGFLMAVDEQ